jgi:hypothetical protein
MRSISLHCAPTDHDPSPGPQEPRPNPRRLPLETCPSSFRRGRLAWHPSEASHPVCRWTRVVSSRRIAGISHASCLGISSLDLAANAVDSYKYFQDPRSKAQCTHAWVQERRRETKKLALKERGRRFAFSCGMAFRVLRRPFSGQGQMHARCEQECGRGVPAR